LDTTLICEHYKPKPTTIANYNAALKEMTIDELQKEMRANQA
jgi:hypothetical protein